MLSYKEDHLLSRASLQQIALREREEEERSQDEKERIERGSGKLRSWLNAHLLNYSTAKKPTDFFDT